MAKACRRLTTFFVAVLLSVPGAANAEFYKFPEGSRVEEPPLSECIRALEQGIQQAVVDEDSTRFFYFWKNGVYFIRFSGGGINCIKLGKF